MMAEKPGVLSCGALGLVVVWLGTFSGCGGTDLATVEGNVTFDGQPVEQGTIAFEPADGLGPVTGGTIENGKYRLAGQAGVPPGKKTVRISAVRKTGRQVEAGSPAPPGTMVEEIEPYIPAGYNQNSTLTCEVSAGAVTQDFDLKSQ